MSTKLDPRLKRVSLDPGRIGRVPLSSTTGHPATNAAGTMRLWSGHRMVYQMPCHPPSLMGLSNAQEFKYYPIFRFPDMGQSANVRLCAQIVNWTYRVDNEHVPAVRWYPSYVPGTPGGAVTLYSSATGEVSSVDYGDDIYPWTSTLSLQDDTFVIATDGGQFRTALLETDSMLPAALAVFRSAPGSAVAADWRTEPADNAYGKVLRSTDDTLPGIGMLMETVTDDDVQSDSLVAAVSSPVFAWGHHHGIWVGQGETDRNIFGASGAAVKICPRPIYQDTTQPLTVVVVYSSGNPCTMTITGSGSASGSATIALSTAANPTCTEATWATNDLVCSTSTPGDLEFTVTTPNNGSTYDWCIIHSISVYPFPVEPS